MSLLGDVKLWLRFEGTIGALVDSSPIGHVVTAKGSTALSTSIKQVGNSSCHFPGAKADQVWVENSSVFRPLSTDIWTCDFRFRPVGSFTGIIVGQWGDIASGSTDLGWYISYSASGRITYAHSSNGLTSGLTLKQWGPGTSDVYNLPGFSAGLPDDTWTRVRIIRNAGNISLYLNGVLQGTTTLGGSAFNSTRRLNVSGSADGGSANNGSIVGYVDELFIIFGDEVPPDDLFPPGPGCPYISQGQARKMVSNVTGLGHLNGEEVVVQADGLPILENGEVKLFTVSGGTLTEDLAEEVAVLHVGLKYDGRLKLLKASDGSQNGTGQFKSRRIYLTNYRLYRSLGFKVGLDDEHLDPVILDAPSLPLITGDLEKTPNTTWGKDKQLLIVQDRPAPLFILAIKMESEVEEGD